MNTLANLEGNARLPNPADGSHNDDKLLDEVCESNQSGILAWFDPEKDEIIADRGFRSCKKVPFKLYVPNSISKGDKQLPPQKANELGSADLT